MKNLSFCENSKKKFGGGGGGGLGGQSGCERRIEVFVKIKKKKFFFGGGGQGGGGGWWGVGLGGQSGCEQRIEVFFLGGGYVRTYIHTDKPKPICPPTFSKLGAKQEYILFNIIKLFPGTVWMIKSNCPAAKIARLFPLVG